ncbi:MAG TPA: STAS domain-containing protein [Acidimicrobiia bacterium]|nr:STAS domain-containing protein [Acidimicrobiia bacterium]
MVNQHFERKAHLPISRAEMAPFASRITTSPHELTLHLEGEWDLATHPLATRLLDDAMSSAPPRRLVVDLTGLEFMGSGGVTALAKARRTSREAGSDFALRVPATGVVPRVLSLFRDEFGFEDILGDG